MKKTALAMIIALWLIVLWPAATLGPERMFSGRQQPNRRPWVMITGGMTFRLAPYSRRGHDQPP